MNPTKRIVAAGVALAAATVLAGCTGDNYKDLKGVPNRQPDYIENVENMDGHPNIGFLCVHGVPILTTTRNNAADLTVVTNPTAVAFCKAKS